MWSSWSEEEEDNDFDDGEEEDDDGDDEERLDERAQDLLERIIDVFRSVVSDGSLEPGGQAALDQSRSLPKNHINIHIACDKYPQTGF